MPEEKACSFNRACGSATDAAESFLGSLFDAKQKIHTESGKEFGTDPGKTLIIRSFPCIFRQAKLFFNTIGSFIH